MRHAVSWLFCPADRPERFAKAAAAADRVIIDLEDGVTPDARPDARRALVDAATELDPERTVVRVNPSGTADQAADLDAVAATSIHTVMLPKAEYGSEVEALAPLRIIVLCETVRGIVQASSIAAASNCDGITWGAQDLAVDLGATSTRDSDGRLLPFAEHARTGVLYAAALAGVPALETVWIDLGDTDGLHATARQAAEEGLAGMLLIHPGQVPVVHDAFAPDEERLRWARRVIEVGDEVGSGAVSVDGQMVDRPILELARRVVERAQTKNQQRTPTR